jgi:hypothetical protein
MRIGLRKLILTFVAVAALASVGARAWADSLNGALAWDGEDRSVLYTDEDREALNNLVGDDANIIDVGDVLYGVLNIKVFTIDVASLTDPLEYELNGSDNSRLYGVFAVKVKSADEREDGSGIWDFTFESYDVFDKELDGEVDGTVMRLYEFAAPASSIQLDSSTLGTSGGRLGVKEAIEAGTYWGSLGFVGDDNGWSAFGSNDITASIVLPTGTRIADGRFAMDRTTETWAYGGAFGQLSLAQIFEGFFTGEATGLINVSSAPGSLWQASSGLSGNLKSVPLPAAAFPGLALVGMVMISAVRRRRRA